MFKEVGIRFAGRSAEQETHPIARGAFRRGVSRKARSILAFAVVLSVLPAWSVATESRIRCQHDPSTRHVSLTVEDGLALTIRAGSEGELLTNSVVCGTATVENTASASISGDTQFLLTLDLRERPLGPVDVPEGTGLMEIEWTLTSDIAEAVIRNNLQQVPAPTAQTTMTPAGVNLNGDDDLDVLFSEAPFLTVFGGFGKDVLSASPGVPAVRMYGGGGADTLDASGVEVAYLFGNGFQPSTSDRGDRLIGGTRRTLFDGGWGRGDTLFGNSPDDTIAFSEWDIHSSINVDLSASAVTKNDRISRRKFSDSLLGRFESVSGGAGDDLLKGDGRDNNMFGDDGNDRIWGFAGDDAISGGKGTDHISAHAGDDLTWSDKSDRVAPGSGDDELFGSGSVTYRAAPRSVRISVRYSARGGYSWLVADGWGHDIVFGYVSFVGTSRDDAFLLGDIGARDLAAGAGDDIIAIASGRNDGVLRAGPGNDTLRYRPSYDPDRKVKVNLAEHTATGWRSVNSIENVAGSRFDDILIGSKGRNPALGPGRRRPAPGWSWCRSPLRRHGH